MVTCRLIFKLFYDSNDLEGFTVYFCHAYFNLFRMVMKKKFCEHCLEQSLDAIIVCLTFLFG